MRPRVRLAVALLVVATVLGPLAIGIAGGSAPPASVCGPCEQPFEYAARGADVDVAVEHSTARVHVHRNGSATWTVRNRLSGPGVEKLREDPDRVDRVAASAVEDRWVSGRDHVLLDAGMIEDDTVELRYRTPDFAERTVGVLRSDYFRDGSGVARISSLGADRLVVVAPEGMTIASGAPGAEVDGRRMTLRTFDSPGDGPFVVFAPADSALGEVQAALVVGMALAPVVLGNLLWLVAVPAGILTVLNANLPVTIASALPSEVQRTRWIAATIAGVAVAVPWLVGEVTVSSFPVFAMVRVWAVGTVVVAAVAAYRPDRFGLHRQGLAILAGLLLGVVGVALTADGVPLGSTRALLTVAGLPTISLLGLPLGFVAEHGARGDRLRAAAVPSIALGAGLLLTQDVAEMGGAFYPLVVLLLVAAVLITTALGLPLVALGATIPRTSPDDDSSGD